MVVLSSDTTQKYLKLGSVCDEGTFIVTCPERIEQYDIVQVSLEGFDVQGNRIAVLGKVK